MRREADVWTIKEGFLLALLPAVALACVHLYEMGRFSYLGVPHELIDLPATRLIAGGAAIAIFLALALGTLQWIRRRLAGKSPARRFFTAFATCFVLLGLPQLLQVTTVNALVWSVLIPLSFALAYVSFDSPTDVVASASIASASETPNAVSFLILIGLFAWTIFGVGFAAERFGVQRTCIVGESTAMIVGFRGEHAIIKFVDPVTKRVKLGVELRELGKSVALQACQVSVSGMPSLFDRAFNKSAAADNRGKGAMIGVDWAATGQMMSGFGGLVAAGATIGLAIVGYRGIGAWREQATGIRRLESAQALLGDIYEVSEILYFVTNPFVSATELAMVERFPNESEEDYEDRRSYAAVSIRLHDYAEQFNKLRSSAFRARAVLGEEVYRSVMKVIGMPSAIDSAGRAAYLRFQQLKHVELRATRESITEIELEKAFAALGAARDRFASIGAGGIQEDIDAAVTECESLLKNELSKLGSFFTA